MLWKKSVLVLAGLFGLLAISQAQNVTVKDDYGIRNGDPAEPYSAPVQDMDYLEQYHELSPRDSVNDALRMLWYAGWLPEAHLTFVETVINRYGYDRFWNILHSDIKVERWLADNDPYHWKQQSEQNRQTVQWEPANTVLEIAIRLIDCVNCGEQLPK